MDFVNKIVKIVFVFHVPLSKARYDEFCTGPNTS